MGIQINGNTDNISAVDGDLSITGVTTFSQFDVGSNIKLGNAGVITATSFVGSGANLTGLNTDLVNDSSPQLGGDLQSNGNNITFGDNDRIVMGDAGTNDSHIRWDTANLHLASAGKVRMSCGGLQINNLAGTETIFNSAENGGVELYYDNAKTLQTTVNALHLFGNQYECNIDLKLDNGNRVGFLGFTNSGRVQINGAAGGNPYETYLEGNLNGSTKLFYDNTVRIETLTEGAKVKRHSGGSTTLYIEGAEGSSAILDMFADDGDDNADKYRLSASSGGSFFMQNYANGGWQNNIVYSGAGSVELYHNNTKRLETFDNNPFVGVSVTNDLLLNSSGDSAVRWAVGGNASSNFKWSMYYSNSGSSLNIFDNVNSRNMASFKETGAIELNYGSSKRLETTANGIEVTGTGTGNFFNAGANALNTTFQSSFGGAGATSVIRIKMNTSALHGIQIQQAGSGTAVAGGNHAATFFNTENAKLRLGTNNTEKFRIEANGDLKGTDTSISSLSDSRLKKNIVDFTYDLNKFKQFKPKTFDWINPELHGNKSSVRGFVAQEIEVIDNTLVGEYELFDETLTDKNPDLEIIKSDDGSNIAKDAKLGTNDAMYISVIQQLITKIETLEAKVTALEGS